MVLVRQFPVPAEGVKLQNSSVEAFVDNDVHGKGSLYITEDNIAWINSDTGEGFKVAYKKMTLHAISRDPIVHSRACLYIMVNGNILDEDENFVVECPADLELEEGEEELTEIRFVPDDDAVLDDMYKAVQECSLLHPDPASDMSNEEDDGPDGIFEGYAGANAGEAEMAEDDDEEDEEDDEAERLEQFIRMQLHFGSRNGNNQNNDEEDNNGDGAGDLDLGFIPEPGQFDDA